MGWNLPLIPQTIDEAVWQILEGKRATEMDVVEAVTMKQDTESATVTDAAIKRWMQSTVKEHQFESA